MAGTDRILIDTSALYAMRSASDLFHGRASSSYRRFVDGNVDFWTTSYVLVETVALLHRRLGFEAVEDFSRWRIDSDVQMVWVNGRMHDAAWERYMEHRGQGLSLVDWTIAVASLQMGAPVFTFDGDFAEEGILVVPR